MVDGERAPDSVFAVVVTFNPELRLLRENLAAVRHQVDGVIVVDNHSANSAGIRSVTVESEASFQAFSENRGLAAALNVGIGAARDVGATAVLLLDQDSICAERMVDALRAGLDQGYDLVGPRIADRNLTVTQATGVGIQPIDYCITSGSLVKVTAWQLIAGFDDRLFIDFVDFDFCLRIRAANGRIARCHEALLHHEIGRAVRHGRFVAYNHSAFRTRHMAEDMLIYARKHRHAPRSLRVHGRGVLLTYAVLLRKGFVIARYEQDRRHKLVALLQGMAAGTHQRSPA